MKYIPSNTALSSISHLGPQHQHLPKRLHAFWEGFPLPKLVHNRPTKSPNKYLQSSTKWTSIKNHPCQTSTNHPEKQHRKPVARAMTPNWGAKPTFPVISPCDVPVTSSDVVVFAEVFCRWSHAMGIQTSHHGYRESNVAGKSSMEVQKAGKMVELNTFQFLWLREIFCNPCENGLIFPSALHWYTIQLTLFVQWHLT